jgi:hypothetical protein
MERWAAVYCGGTQMSSMNQRTGCDRQTTDQENWTAAREEMSRMLIVGTRITVKKLSHFMSTFFPAVSRSPENRRSIPAIG